MDVVAAQRLSDSKVILVGSTRAWMTTVHGLPSMTVCVANSYTRFTSIAKK